MNKKASTIFIPALTLLAITTLIFAYITITTSFQEAKKHPIGTNEHAILKTNQIAEKALLYVDTAARYSLMHAVFKLASQGGHYVLEPSTTSCGHYVYQLWNNETNLCTPKVQENLFSYVDDQLVPSLYQYPYPLPTGYFYTLETREGKNYLIGKANTPLNLIIHTGPEPLPTATSGVLMQVGQCNPVTELVDQNKIRCLDNACKLESTALQKLYATNDYAKTQGYVLVVKSTTRTMQQQAELFATCLQTHDESYCSKKVCKPSCGTSTCPHLTGKAIDVTLYTNTGQLVDMGSMDTPYGPGAKFTPEQISNHQLLEKLMCDQDWVRYGDSQRTKGEWWHFEYQTKRWQDAKQQDVTLCSI